MKSSKTKNAITENDHPLLDVSKEDTVPYFMWDYRYTVGQIKKILAGDNKAKRMLVNGKNLERRSLC